MNHKPMKSMREIKFRAWDKKEKRWCHQTEVCIEAGGTYWHWCNKETENKLLNCPGIELSQFTGFKNRNRKEIYEKNILKNDSDREKPVIIEAVEWDNHLTNFYFWILQ